MKITDIYKEKNAQHQSVISLEIFPPKTNVGVETIYKTVAGLTKKPDFISVTYGAMGSFGRENKTLEIAEKIKKDDGIETMHHLTSINNNPEQITEILADIKAKNVKNILALRGDVPANACRADFPDVYHYAHELIADIKKAGDFDIGAAIYPEGHVDSPFERENIDHVKAKHDAGANFFVSQLFFDNDKFLRLNDAVKNAAIEVPIAAGIMPVLQKSQAERMIFFGASLPTRLIKIINKYKDSPEDLQKAGMAYACQQIDELLSQGVDGVHIYTMNKPFVANGIMAKYL
ncbi:methylenetetrahydrofolate reductase [Lactococcus hodotermopsidis]|uniref:Methylenetetrahydrofolate reductase n=1 Tax=Pseudolactococcus hodotermopsidis TaxID=2709157 RepID=A0A6A0BAI1_9LACT|nr:methylenetetrahydrofolate reductase [Lactococcus hodotermopsidis]GFH41643.1 methylenetetrahydrofolate reductase [Lactococcus hodotermopsidis]